MPYHEDCITCSQLGVSFPVVLEANHVVNMATQVWAGAITAGCDGIPLTVCPCIDSPTPKNL